MHVQQRVLRLIAIICLTAGSALSQIGCEKAPSSASDSQTQSLADARKAFKTKLTEQIQSGEPVAQPPGNLFRVVQYDAQPGKLLAYVTPDPRDGKKHPAIIWITGGDCNTIGDVWTPATPDNDQTAAAYREAGMIMMFPSLRGGNQNPGTIEGFYGEVDDVLAAAKYLAAQPYVDPARIYLGGHSTGGTLALLVAECSSDTFRAVFSFGPVADVTQYGFNSVIVLPFSPQNKTEAQLRAPGLWLNSIKTPTFIFEGTEGNSDSLRELANRTAPNVQCFLANGMDHFNILSPTNKVIAAKILNDTGATTNLAFTASDVAGLQRLQKAP